MKYKYYNDENTNSFEKRRSPKPNYYDPEFEGHEKQKRVIYDTQNFKCSNCGFFVSADRGLSGVNNRNHCPRCLWSLHVDLNKAGDRKAECRSRMQPVGLTVKQTSKRYGDEKQGELMLIHSCTGCGKISINRIAADDDVIAIYNLYLHSHLDEEIVKTALEPEGIYMLTARDLTIVYAQLFGWSSLLEEFNPAVEVDSKQTLQFSVDEDRFESE